MIKIERIFVIDVPIDNVFSYMSDPIKVVEWLPGLCDVRDIVGMGVNQQHSWTYKMMGILLSGKAKCTEHVPNKRIVIETTGSIRSNWTWTFESRIAQLQ